MKQNKNVYKFILLILLTIILGAFTHCMSEFAPPTPVQESPIEHGDLILPPPSNTYLSSGASVGIKNYEQILVTMSVLTGYSYTQQVIRNAFREVTDSLPTENDISEFSASSQVAIIKLAAEYCHRTVESSGLRSELWPEFNFGLRPNQNAFSFERKQHLVHATIDRFWGGQELSQVEIQDAEARLLELIDDLLEGERVDSTTTTRNVVKGLCTTALSSAYVTLL